MLSPADIEAQAVRKYPAVLRAIAGGESIFPMEIRFGRPAPTADWTALQTEITALAQANLGFQIEWEELNTRRWGRQRLPTRVWFADETAYLELLGKTSEVECLRANLILTRQQCPALTPWVVSHVMRVVEHARVWPEVLCVCRYFVEHPRPGRYARELPIPVGTKFIEERRALFRSLLDFLLPAETIDSTTEHFESRFGLRFDEPLVRMRILCPALANALRAAVTDFSAPLSQCGNLSWAGHTVLIVENKMTFLTLPPLTDTLAIWGGGNAAALLTSLSWLTKSRLFYWGDLDVHGFHILARLREAFPEVRSVLMDATLLDEFGAHRVPAGNAGYEHTAALTRTELETYARVQRDRTLLEQEKIPHARAVAELHRVVSPAAPPRI